MWEKEKPAAIFLREKWKLLYFLLHILFSLLFGKKNSDHNNDLSILSIDKTINIPAHLSLWGDTGFRRMLFYIMQIVEKFSILFHSYKNYSLVWSIKINIDIKKILFSLIIIIFFISLFNEFSLSFFFLFYTIAIVTWIKRVSKNIIYIFLYHIIVYLENIRKVAIRLEIEIKIGFN